MLPWLNNLDAPMNLPVAQQVMQDLAPYFKGIQNSFGQGFSGFYIVALVLALVLGLLWAINTLMKHKTDHKPVKKKPRNNSTLLFNHMLDQLDLTTSDRALLQQMARETRLRHPAVFLLSPDMLNWSRNIWLQEKGAEHIHMQKLEQIDRIGQKLFHEPMRRQVSQATVSSS